MRPHLRNLFLLPALLATLGLFPAGRLAAQTYSVLHTFSPVSTPANSDGAGPLGGLIISGNTLYGTTTNGGASNEGTVFKVNADGTGFTTLHSFTALQALIISLTPFPQFTLTNSDGANPQAALLLSGNALYGTAAYGGSQGNGTVFRVNTDGTGFTNLHNFSGTSGDGQQPLASLIISGNTLYGMTAEGGSAGYGMIFALNTDGTGYTNIYSFTGGGASGDPHGGLVLSGNTLFGTLFEGGFTGLGGGVDAGTIFAVNTDGTGFTNLHNFSRSTFNNVVFCPGGAYPGDGLILSGNILYGTAANGGASDDGVVFAMNTDGTGFTILHQFAGSPAEGAYPVGVLTLSGGFLYGTTSAGGATGNGTVFALNTDGTGFTNLYDFATYPGTGAFPCPALLASGSRLFGTTLHGGSSGNGSIFTLNTTGTGITNVHDFTALFPPTNSDGAIPVAGLISSGNLLYGTSRAGGSGGNGTVFAYDTRRASFSTLHSFTATNGSAFTNQDGASPYSGLVLSGGTLYGTALGGGTAGFGTIFSLNTNGLGFTVLHQFTGAPADGAAPYAGLIVSGNTLYGTTWQGGISNNGTVFAINTDGTGFTNLHSFVYPVEGYNPYGGVILSGNTLYGTTEYGGQNNSGYPTTGGSVFALNTDGTGFRTLCYFNPYAGGSSPLAGLVLSGNTLYGTTASGGGFSGLGTVFAINTDGTGLTYLHNFTGVDGHEPEGNLILSGNTLYGTTLFGGTNFFYNFGFGNIFAVNTDGTGFTNLYQFNNFSGGGNPEAGLVLSDGTLYGTGLSGIIFSLFFPPQLNLALDGGYALLTWPTNYTGYTVQTATNLNAPVWRAAALGPVVIGTQNLVIDPVSNTQKFYRLSR